jgi:hypothetical protein
MRNYLTVTSIRASLIASLAIVSLLSGCTKSSSGNGGGSDSPSSSDNKTATTACGVVFDGKLQNPIALADGQKVTLLDVLSNNLVAVSPDSGKTRIVVKLQGVESSTTTSKNSQAEETIRSLLINGGYFYKATSDCNTGSSGTIGSLLTNSGTSVNEEVVKRGFAPADTNDACNGSLLGPCYQALDESTDENQTSSNVGCGFLWKPVSDKDGNLAILVDECSVRVFVNGQELEQAGAGNARCTTVRGDKPGCAYGNATIEIFDAFTGLPYVFNGGKTKLTVNGCQRFELPCE